MNRWCLAFSTIGLIQPTQAAEPDDHELIYFVLVDRFSNGLPDTQDDVDPTDPQAFHGGDIQGVIDQLDHIQAMGVTTIWLSPIAKMQSSRIGQWGAYHGYWITDHMEVEPRFGDFDTLKRLGIELQKRDMSLVLDMVYNHFGPENPLVLEHPDWLHDTGDIVDWSNPIERRTHRGGLPISIKTFQIEDYLVQVTRHWLNQSAASGLRIDAIGHMDPNFIDRLGKRIEESHPNVWLLGEDFQGDPVGLEQTAQISNVDALFDFPLYYALTDTVCKRQPMGRLASTLSMDRVYQSEVQPIIFLDNHDLPRISSICNQSDLDVRLSLHVLFSLRGTPSVTYGTEVGLDGLEEPDNRKGMIWDSETNLMDEIHTLWELRQLGPAHTDDEVLALTEHSLILLRRGETASWLVFVHLGDQPTEFEWPSDLSHLRVLQSAHFEQGQLTVKPEGPTPSAVVAEPGSVHRWLLSRQPPRSQESHTWNFEITADALCSGSTLSVVGAGPELGNWDPAKGIMLRSDEEGLWSASIEVPPRQVYAWHLVVQPPEGSAIWEPGMDRFTLIGPSSDGSETTPYLSTAHWAGKGNCP